MAGKDNAEQQAPSKKKIWLKRIMILLLIGILIIAGFFLGIYLKILDSDEMNEKMGLYDMPVVGEYFAKPAPNAESTVPDEVKSQDSKKDKQSKALKLSKEEVEKLTQQRQAEEKKRVSKLARLYNEMKPADAAKILQDMDNDIVISIFQRMDESQVSQILTEFEVSRAAEISKIMYVGAPKRVQNPGGPGTETTGGAGAPGTDAR